MTRVGIALYYIRPSSYNNTPGYFHWVLVASDGDSWAVQPVRAMELKRPTVISPFVHSFSNVDVASDRAFIGIVHLFDTNRYTAETLTTTIRDKYPAQDSGWRFPGRFGPPGGWTCATWILQILSDLRTDHTWVDSSDFDTIAYTRVLNLANDILEEKETNRFNRGTIVCNFERR